MTGQPVKGMGNCFPFIKRKQKGNVEVTLAILGLDNAGKTTTTKCIKGESLEGIAPTVGFDRVEFSLDKFNINLYDLGGGRTIRDIWTNYLAEVYGVIYVVDSSDSSRLGEARDVMDHLLEQPKVKGKPILLLANKQDKENALDDGELIEELNLEYIVNQHKCPCRLELCSAKIGVGKKMDKPIKLGLRWLLNYVSLHMTELEARVKSDSEEQRKVEAREREERRERVRKIREEREKERKERGEVDEDEEDISNPFKPLTLEEIKKKEAEEQARSKAEKQRLNGEQSRTLNIEQVGDERRKADEPEGRDWTVPRPPVSPLPMPLLSTDPSTEPRSNRLKPLNFSSGLQDDEPLDEADQKKHKKKRRSSRKNRLGPAPDSDIDMRIGSPSNGFHGVHRFPSQPDLFVTEQVYALDDLNDGTEVSPATRSKRQSKPLRPNGDIEEIVT